MVCPRNRMVDCDDQRVCYKCGWNPAVSAQRSAKVMAKINDGTIDAQINVIKPEEEVWRYSV